MRTAATKTVVAGIWVISFYAGNAFTQGAPPGGTTDTLSAAQTPRQASAPHDSTGLAERRPAADSAKTDTVSLEGFSFMVTSDPAGALVSLDDSLRGESPCRVTGVPAGKHVLTIKKKGFYLKRAEIVVDSALGKELSFSLLRPGFLRIESDPAGASLSIDGKIEGITPYQNDKVKPGEHIVKLELKHYAPLERTITMENGGRDTVRCTLDHSAVYNDSVTASRRKEMRSGRERVASGIASALFCLGAAIMILVGTFDDK